MKFDRNQEILELVDEGYTYTQVASKYGITKQCVANIVKKQRIRNDFLKKHNLVVDGTLVAGKTSNKIDLSDETINKIVDRILCKMEERNGK